MGPVKTRNPPGSSAEIPRNPRGECPIDDPGMAYTTDLLEMLSAIDGQIAVLRDIDAGRA